MTKLARSLGPGPNDAVLRILGIEIYGPVTPYENWLWTMAAACGIGYDETKRAAEYLERHLIRGAVEDTSPKQFALRFQRLSPL